MFLELNRNHYFAVGTIVLLLGLQLRFVESFRLNEASSRFIAEKIEKNKQPANANPFSNLLAVPANSSRRVVHPPRWIGWALVSVGGVLILHSLALKRPG